MRNMLILFVLFNFLGCTNFTQTNSSKLIIDENLNNSLFENIIYGVEGRENSIYIDSVLVYSNDSSKGRDIIINADIIELNKKHSGFDTCKSFFLGDTLIVEFGGIASLVTDKMRLKIINDEFWAYLGSKAIPEYILGFPKILKFKNRINKKGQEIFGELGIDFSIPKLKMDYSFKGFFRCVVE